MGFLRRLFGNSGGDKPYHDADGLYFYVQCARCQLITRVRADKRHDLNRTDGGHQWHKTIIDGRCFQPIRVHVILDGNHNVVTATATGGQFVDAAAFAAQTNTTTEEEE